MCSCVRGVLLGVLRVPRVLACVRPHPPSIREDRATLVVPYYTMMLINEDTGEYESGDDADPDSTEETEDGLHYADATHLPSIVCTPRALSVTPSPAEHRCNLFQTRAAVGNGRSCKVIIDGGSCHNLASKELC